MRYGTEHATSCDALSWLMLHPEPPRPHERSTVLTCRAAVLIAAAERCELAIRGPDMGAPFYQSWTARPQVAALVSKGPETLLRLLKRYERFPDDTVALSDTLSWGNPSRTLRTWQAAARASFLATQTAVADRAWAAAPRAAWAAVGDSADLVGAICLLDRRQPVVETSRLWVAREELLIVARHVGVLASGDAAESELDELLWEEEPTAPLMLHSLRDLSAGMDALTRSVESGPVSVRELRVLSIAQSQIAGDSGRMAGFDPALQQWWEGLKAHYRRLAAATTRARSVSHTRSAATQVQLAEVAGVLRRTDVASDPSTLSGFAAAHGRFARALAKAVARGVRSGDYLVSDAAPVALSWIPARGLAEVPLLDAASAISDHGLPDAVLTSDARVVDVGLEGKVLRMEGVDSTPAARRRLRSGLEQPAFQRPRTPRSALRP